MIAFTIYGEPASKANQRKVADVGPKHARRRIFIKSGKALKYEQDFLAQIPRDARVQIAGPVKVTIWIFYASERPDLDASLILDCLQNRYRTVVRMGKKQRELDRPGVYVNDRQVKELHCYHAIDKDQPRADITIEELRPELFAPVPARSRPAVGAAQALEGMDPPF